MKLFLFFLLSAPGLLFAQGLALRGTITVKKNPVFEFDRGEGLFERNCDNCHSPYYYSHEQRGHITILNTATSKYEMSWLLKFLRFPRELEKEGDKDVLRINNQVKYHFVRVLNYSVSGKHPNYHQLDNGQITAIFFYVDSLCRRKEEWKNKSDEN